MTDTESGRNILGNLKKTLKGRVDKVISHALRPDIKSGLFVPEFADETELLFAKNLVQVKGKFSYSANKQELISNLSSLFQSEQWNAVYCPEPSISTYLDMAGIPYFHDPDKIDLMEIAVTGCEFLIARTGSVMVSSTQAKGRRVFAHAPIHIVIASTSQLKNEIGDALSGIIDKYDKMPSMLTTITGPSRTADIEKTLVLGMHGPQELYVFLIKDK